MIDPTTWFWVGAAGMTAGTVAFAWNGISAGRAYRRYYATLVGISAIAAVAYALMALEIGWLAVGDRTVYAPRYVDWILTTPLLLAFLGMLVDLDRRRYVPLIGLNTVVMVLGFAASLTPGVERFALFGVASIAYLGLCYLLAGPVAARAREHSGGVDALFTGLRNLTVVLWSIYPVIWLLGPPGVGLLTAIVDVVLITYLDLVTKVGFGLIALNASAVIEAERGPVVASAADAAD